MLLYIYIFVFLQFESDVKKDFDDGHLRGGHIVPLKGEIAARV